MNTTEGRTMTKPLTNEMVYLANGNVMINGREMTKAAYLKMTRRQMDKLAGEYAAKR
jgi:hypothetical protein